MPAFKDEEFKLGHYPEYHTERNPKYKFNDALQVIGVGRA